MSVNFILYVFFCGQGRALSLRYDIEFNLIAADNRHISVNYYGGSKPPPYRVGYIFSIRAKHPLLFTFHCSFSLPCVKGAGLLWRPLHLMQKHRPNRQVRRWVAARQLGGIVKQKSRTTARVVPTVAYIFSFDKTQAPSDEGAVERSETEGEKAINIKFSLSLPQSFFLWKNDSPLKDGAEARI